MHQRELGFGSVAASGRKKKERAQTSFKAEHLQTCGSGISAVCPSRIGKPPPWMTSTTSMLWTLCVLSVIAKD